MTAAAFNAVFISFVNFLLIGWCFLREGRGAYQPNINYRGTSTIRNSTPLGPYSRTVPRSGWLRLGLFRCMDDGWFGMPTGNSGSSKRYF